MIANAAYTVSTSSLIIEMEAHVPSVGLPEELTVQHPPHVTRPILTDSLSVRATHKEK